MTSEQNAFLQMCSATRVTADAHHAAWAGMETFTTPWSRFLHYMGDADAALALQMTTSTGITEDKAAIRNTYTAHILHLADVLNLIGRAAHNTDLQRNAYEAPSTVRKMEEKELIGHGLHVRSLTAAHSAALAANGISPEWLTAYDESLASFNGAIGGPQHAITERARGTELLAKAIADLRAVLTDELDLAARVLQYTQPAFFTEWDMSRAIHEAGSTTRALTVTVVDHATSEPLAGAQATLNPGNLEKSSGDEGMFYIQSMAGGTYQMQVTKAGYEPCTRAFDMDANGGVQLEVRLVPGGAGA